MLRLISIADGRRGTLPDEGSRFLRLGANDIRRLRCAVCDAPVDPQGNYRLDAYGTAVCHQHMVSECGMCGRIITGNRVVVPNYGYACVDCGTPCTMEDLLEVRDTVNAFYEKKRLYIPPYRLGLLHAQAMWEKYDKYFHTPVFGAAWRDDGSPDYHYRIDVMSQQSHVGLARTLAHEVLHLWQYYRGIEAPADYAEGFCNLGAYLLLTTIAEGEALVSLSRMMEEPDRRYGVAFRQLKVLYDAYGWQAVIQAMRNYKRQ